jgi:hypothetical protein
MKQRADREVDLYGELHFEWQNRVASKLPKTSRAGDLTFVSDRAPVVIAIPVTGKRCRSSHEAMSTHGTGVAPGIEQGDTARFPLC